MDEAVFPAVSVEPYTTLVKDMEAYRLGVARVNVTLANLAEERQRILDAGRELGWKMRPLEAALPIPSAEDAAPPRQAADSDFSEVEERKPAEAAPTPLHLHPVPEIDSAGRARSSVFSDGDNDA